jgi:hypothetical protein
MANALPIILMGGAALLLMGGKKKTRPKEVIDLPDIIPDIVPVDIKPPVIPPNQPMPYWKRAGSTDRGSTYEGAWWGATGEKRLEKIRQFFSNFGYPVEVGPWPMNVLGPAGEVELTNKPGSVPEMGKLGGGDDQENPIVEKFQKEYNAVSKAHLFGGSKKMGGLAPDGLVGPYVLNGLRFVKENLGAKLWKDVVAEAAKTGNTA